MSCLKLWVVFCILLASSVQHAVGQGSKLFMELYEFDNNNTSNTIIRSGCNNGSVNDVDYFTVRGKVNKNGADPNAYVDTNLYLQAVRDPSTNAWASQCRPDLSVCSTSLNTDCYCERKDPNGDYHIVMTIMAKSIYSGGKLMLSWNDARSPYNPPMTSNVVDYYPDPIRKQEYVTLETMLSDGSLVKNTNFIETKSLNIPYDPNMTNLTFCVYNLEAIEFIQIEKGGEVLATTSTEKCVTLDIDLDEEYKGQELRMSFAESGGCERTDSYTLHFTCGPVPVNVTLEVMTTTGVVGNTSFDENKSLRLIYKPEMTNLTFCVYNLKAIGLIQIEKGGKVLANTMTEECVTLDIDLDEEYKNQVLNMSFAESGGCERTDSYTLYLKPHDTTTTTDKPSSTTDGSPGSSPGTDVTSTPPTTINDDTTTTTDKPSSTTDGSPGSSPGTDVTSTPPTTINDDTTTTTDKPSSTTDGSPGLSSGTDVTSTPPTTINGSTTVTPTTTTNGTTSEPEKQVTEPWIIVVGCLGGILGAVFVIAFIICCLRRKKEKRKPSATTLESTPGAHQQQYQKDVYTMPRNLAPYQYNVKQTPSSKPGEHHHHHHHRDEYDKPGSMTSL